MEKPTKKTVVSWRNFLASPEGVVGLLYLKSQAPIPFPDVDGKMIFAAGATSGYNQAFDEMEKMIEDAARESTRNESPDTLED
jgi:hypothetical protein